jgi:hypothetical protein
MLTESVREARTGVRSPGGIKIECMVGHFDLWAGPQSLRHVVAALEIAYQSTMVRMLL